MPPGPALATPPGVATASQRVVAPPEEAVDGTFSLSKKLELFSNNISAAK